MFTKTGRFVERKIIPTQIKVLDSILGGGIEERGITLIVGIPGAGKTQLSIQIASQFKKHGYQIFYLDTEIAVTETRAKAFGLDLNDLIQYAPTIEELDEAIESELLPKLQDKKTLLVIDSISALSTKQEFSSLTDSIALGIKANLLTRLINKLFRYKIDYNLTVIITAHMKENISLTPFGATGLLAIKGKYRVPGGAALLYAANQMLYLITKETKELAGNVQIRFVEVGVIKNRLFTSGKNVKIAFSDKYGFFDLLSSLQFLVDYNVIESKQGRLKFPFTDKSLLIKDVITLYKNDTKFREQLDNLINTSVYEILVKPYMFEDNVSDSQTEMDILANIQETEDVLSTEDIDTNKKTKKKNQLDELDIDI